MEDQFDTNSVSFRLSPVNFSSNDSADLNNLLRMGVTQTTYAILISVLLVVDLFLVWALGYIVIFYERRGRLALRNYRAIRGQKEEPPINR